MQDLDLTSADERPITETNGADVPALQRRSPLSIKRLAGPVVGLLLLLFYLALLARDELDAALPGGSRLALALLALATAATLGARTWQSGVRGATIWRWATLHLPLLLISGITLAALGLRLFGIGAGLPYLYHPDEPAVADRALAMLRTGDFNPHYFVYPTLYYYMQAGLYILRFFAMVSSSAVESLDGVKTVDFYLWGRALTALLGATTVPLVYLAGRRLYGVKIGLIAALFLATNTIYLFNSQWITTDVPAGFFSGLALLAIVRLLPARGTTATASPTSAYVLAGIAVGLAIGAKYNSALLILPLLIAHAYAGGAGERVKSFFSGRLWSALGALGAAFLITTPFAILDLPHFLNDLASVISHYRFGHGGHESDSNWLYYASSLLHSDTLPTVLTLLGVALAFVRHRRNDVVLLSFPLAFYLSMSAYRVNFEHNLTPILPFTSILGGLGLVMLWRGVRLALARVRPARAWLRPALYAGLVVAALLAVWPATALAVQHGYLYTQPDNRIRAEQWLNANAAPHAKIFLEPNTLELSNGLFLVGHGDHVVDHPAQWYIDNQYEFAVIGAAAYKNILYENFASDPDLAPAYMTYFKANESRLVAAFEKNPTDHPGPTMLIYATGYAPPHSPADVKAQHPFSATFQEGNGGTVQLLGADYPATITAGTRLPLALYWNTIAPLRLDYTIFVHMVDANDATPVQRDTGPLDGTYPTSQWHKDEIVVDGAGLDLPANLAPGAYMLRIGIYQQVDNGAGPALPVTTDLPGSGQSFIQLGPITVAAPN